MPYSTDSKPKELKCDFTPVQLEFKDSIHF